MLASWRGHLDVVRELIMAQADMNVQNKVCSLQCLLRVCYTPGREESFAALVYEDSEYTVLLTYMTQTCTNCSETPHG